jgi:hypothetical protein
VLRVPEYWELWARLLEAETERAWRKGDQDRWRSLKEAREIALQIAHACHEREAREDAEYLESP